MEMNLHMPQDPESESELKNLAAVPYQIISPANNSSIIGIFQDSMLGSFRFTRENIRFTPRDAMNLLMMFPRVNEKVLLEKVDKNHYVTNFDLLSQILPPLTLQYKNKLFGDDEDAKTSNNVLEIRDGEYIRGQMDKGVLGAGTKGIIHRICNDFGNRASADFIDDLQNIITEYMKTSSYSVGIRDLISDEKTNQSIIKIITEKKQEVKDLIDQTQIGVFENKTGKTNQEEFETQVNNILNKASSEAGNAGLKNLDKNNRFVIMVNAGSKGSELNISQMISCLGQQNVDGHRIPYGFEHRTLPHYSKYDDSPSARGFVESSFINGLTPQELFFHAMGGRVGLIDTAVKSVTWETPIVFIENGQPKYVEIGRWIDGQLDDIENQTKVQHFTERQMELLNIEEGRVYIPTTDENGVVTWGDVTAITRHDPGTELYEIKTSGGRSVIVTESKSLLIWNPETKKLKETPTPEIQVGDCVPVTRELCEPPIVLNDIDMTGFYNEKFMLNEENGVFIGIFLAKGTIKNNELKINTDNENLQNFITEFLNKGIVNGSFVINYLSKLIENGNQHVPTESYIAPIEFVKGVLSGFYTENSAIGKQSETGEDSIIVHSTSKRLLEGISMLLSRFGIFGCIECNDNSNYYLIVSEQWGAIFAEKIPLLEEKKQEKLKSIQWNNTHRNFDTYNDVVLDKITEINIIGVENHPKVYDLTIPSTLNFGLANGLQVRDTSTTGYIQRRLIKGLEDLMVSYDMTVRTNKGNIVQFTYGDDGVDPVKVENQSVPFVSQGIQDIYAHFNLPDETGKNKTISQIFLKATMTRYKKQMKETQEKCKFYTDMMIEKRDEIVKYVFRNKNDSVVNVPVSFSHIIMNTQGQHHLNASSVVDITPLEVFQMIEEAYTNLEAIRCAVPTALFKTLYFYNLSPKDLLFVRRFNRAALTSLLETITLSYKRAIVAPGEMVGMIAAQSIGEPTTQLTLNSVTYETEILVRDANKRIHKVQIGDFVEGGIKTSQRIDYMADKDTTYAELLDYYDVPGSNESGETVWRRIEAVTRHPVINEDGTNTMLKVTTEGNREVFATKAKSFLQLTDGKIVGVNGAELRVGQYLPVSKKALEFQEQFELNLREILPPTEYLYGSELEKAKEVYLEPQWWKKHANKTFTLPHSRSDAVVSLFKDVVRKGRTPNKSQLVKPGNVYMKNITSCEYDIPETIQLDYEFGYLVGAYCAEGCMTKHQVSIANNDDEYLKPIKSWCEKHNLTTKVYTHTNKIKEGWNSQDIRIYNTLLCRILSNLGGKLSHNKFVSDKIVFSNRECCMGFLDAYIGGDGCVNQRKKSDGSKCCTSIYMASVSYNMLLDVQVMLKNLGIVSKMYKPKKAEKNNRGTLPENIHQGYQLMVSNEQSKKLASMLNMKIVSKQEKADKLLNEDFKYEYYRNFDIVPNVIQGECVMETRNGRFPDIEFDKIIKIEEVPNTTNYAYDLTVEETRTFDCYNGLTLNDTFHSAGLSTKSNVTRGVPRIEELLSLSSEPKNPSLTVFMKPEDETEREKAQSIMYMLEHTKLQELVSSIEVCFDPDDLNTLIEEDKETMLQYREFENMMDDCANAQVADNNEKSKWIIRMVMNPEVMLEKNITMDDINFTLKSSYQDEISCVYSDYNMDKLIFRIRMNNIIKASSGKGAKKVKVNPLDQTDQIYLLKNFQDQLLNNIIIRGIKKINKVILRKIKDNVTEKMGVYKKEDIWVLDTIGTNLMDVLALDYIDSSRTYTNDIVETYNVFGIEAARQAIFNELTDVLSESTYINYHHMCMLCDRMTYSQKMISIFRHGINNDNIGPIAKASFEETPEMFLKAARHAELDNMRGVSANVMCGQEGLFGTNAFQVVLDMSEMQRLEETTPYEYMDVDETIEKMFGDVENPQDLCSIPSLTIQSNISSIKTTDLGTTPDEYNPGF
jgi:DNA-directed RNA polymerase beta' subunit